MDNVTAQLNGDLPPSECLDRVRRLTPHFAADPGTEVLTVEGFLPVDPPLLFDVLSHSDFRSDPQTPHAGFLPSRREMPWYRETVNHMFRWLERFDHDLETLAGVRGHIQGVVAETEQRLDSEYAHLQVEARERVQEATLRSENEIAALHAGFRGQIQQQVVALRRAQAIVAHAEASVATAQTLSFRATHRRVAEGGHLARRERAESDIRKSLLDAAEARNAIERIHAAERSGVERLVANVTWVEQGYARALADRELFRDEFSAAGLDLVHAVDGQIAARAAQKNLLAGYFLPVASLADVRVVWFPLWLATLRGSRGVRQLVFPPMQVRAGLRLGAAIKQLLGGVVLPVEPRTAQFDTVLRATMEDALRKDPWLSTATRELTRAADVLVDSDVLHRLQQGLRELGRGGWITAKQEKHFLAAYASLAQRRAGAPPAAPPGATSPLD
ncbi:MAG: hypothetical protein ACREDE_09350, partial [Thermoplasmata archaeon]